MSWNRCSHIPHVTIPLFCGSTGEQACSTCKIYKYGVGTGHTHKQTHIFDLFIFTFESAIVKKIHDFFVKFGVAELN